MIENIRKTTGTDLPVADVFLRDHFEKTLRNLEKSCDGFCLKPWRISIYNRTVREKSSFVVMEVV